MDIRHIEMVAQPGGFSKLTAVVSGDRTQIANDVRSANFEPGEWEITISKKRRKRSLDANGYAWVLIGKIADAIDSDKISVYKETIKNVPSAGDVVCIKTEAVPSFVQSWSSRGIGWQWEEIPCKLEGFSNLMLYSGSSEFDTKQMATFIDLLIAECKELKISTMTPEELERLKGYGGQDNLY